MTHPTNDTRHSYREIGVGQHHARTELCIPSAYGTLCFSIKGTGPEVRKILVKHAEGKA